MNEFYTKIQVYLMKKDRECEKLRFLTSRTTPLNEAHVSEVCNTIKTILKDSSSSNTDDNSVKNFQFLLLNTNFRAQEHLCEDIANGHLVDMCPPLSPYLFIQILWALDYDDIMCNSILYIPIDLCSEILDTVRRCLDLDFQRSFNVVLKVIRNCYKKLILTIQQDTQVLDEQESLKRFIGSIQELISLLPDLQSKKIKGLSPLLKYQRSGWVLIQLVDMIKDCIATRREASPVIGNETSEKLYRVTFGRDYMARINLDSVSEAVGTLSEELIDLLLNNVKKIDCYVYMGWAELDYDDDSSISMQRAVGLSCYNFVEFLRADERPEEYSHIIECLEQLSSQPDAPFSMSLQELCSEVDKGNKVCLRKLIQRFEEWDSTTISCFDVNRIIIDKGECLSLLNGAVEFLEISSKDQLCAEVYGTAMKILLGQRLVDLVEIIVEFILMHNASRALESINFQSDLNSYINNGLALCSNKTSLRIILGFFIQNPREVLNVLIRAAVGYPEYTHSVILPENLCELSMVMKIRGTNEFSLLSNSLRDIFADNVPWNGKKFVNLMRGFLDKKVLSADDLVNDIFIPGLQNDIILQNIQSVITCLRTMKGNITQKMKKQDLLYVLALQMNYLRKKNDLSIHIREEVLHMLIRIIQQFSNNTINPTVDYGEDLLSQKLEASIEPLNQIYFAPNCGWIRNEISLDQVIPDYKRRCVHVINETKPVRNRFADIDVVLEAHGLQTGDFLQHLILQFTEFEYLKFAKNVLILHPHYFGWENELDAYAQFSLATIKACHNNLEYFDPMNSWENSAQKFSSLIKSLAKLTTWFISIDVMTNYASVHKSLVHAMNVSNQSTNYYQKFETSPSQSTDAVYSYQIVADLVHNVEKFGEQISHHCSRPVANTDPRSLTALKFYLNSTFISICMNWPIEENSLLVSKIDKKLYSKR